MSISRPHASADGMVSAVASAVPGGERPGSIQRRGLAQEKMSEPRLKLVCECIDGCCGVVAEPKTACRGGCGRSLHMLSCAKVGKGYAALGNFKCHRCMALELVEVGLPTVEVLSNAAVTMLYEMTQGAEATAGAYAEFAKLEELYASGMGMQASGGRLVLPHSNKTAFKNFLTWLTFDHDRALSLQTVVIGAESMMSKLGLQNVAKDPDVKAHVKKLMSEHGLESTPSTAATPAMLKALPIVIDARFSSDYLRSRWLIEMLLEGVGGLRIGEAVGGGDFHGLLANNCSIITNSVEPADAWAQEVVEVKIEHSKTGFSRYVDMAGLTEKSKIPVAGAMRQFWRAAGIETTVVPEAGMMVERPDFWVVRVSLLGMNARQLVDFKGWLLASRWESIARHAKHSANAAGVRDSAQGAGSQAKKYVNIAGGRGSSDDIATALAEVNAYLFELLPTKSADKRHPSVSVVPGPLICTTVGKYIGLMPLASSSTHGTVKELLEKACEVANKEEPDPDMSTQERKVAKFTNHSLRRCSDATARRDRAIERPDRRPVSETEIDIYHGWHELELSKEMQLHYATLVLRERIQRARITGLM